MSLFNGIKWPYATMQQLNLDWILEKVRGLLDFLPSDGAAGQILRRTADGAEWSDGADVPGTVHSINGIGVSSGTNNVVLTAENVGAAAVPLHLQATATSLPLTINNSAITATMRVIECTFGTPTAINGDVTWTTSSGSIVLSGTMSGSTTVDLVLIETT